MSSGIVMSDFPHPLMPSTMPGPEWMLNGNVLKTNTNQDSTGVCQIVTGD